MAVKLRQPDRRSMLIGMGMIAAAGGLAACGSDNTPASGSGGSSAGNSSSNAAGSGNSAAAGNSIPKSKVPVGGGYLDTAQQVVVSQPTANTFKAFSTICTHQGCPMTALSGTSISCSCHGSKFKITDGSVENGPASKPLNEKSVTASGDNLVIG
ncbi:Rieske (2Fe-2S) protein [Calidifontibacter terrae]